MKEIRDAKGRLTALTLNKEEWKKVTKFNKDASKKRDDYIKRIKEKHQFKELKDGTVVGKL